jgi:hypothetical protein
MNQYWVWTPCLLQAYLPIVLCTKMVYTLDITKYFRLTITVLTSYKCTYLLSYQRWLMFLISGYWPALQGLKHKMYRYLHPDSKECPHFSCASCTQSLARILKSLVVAQWSEHRPPLQEVLGSSLGYMYKKSQKFCTSLNVCRSVVYLNYSII